MNTALVASIIKTGFITIVLSHAMTLGGKKEMGSLIKIGGLAIIALNILNGWDTYVHENSLLFKIVGGAVDIFKWIFSGGWLF